jgi:hypothetical protein
LGRARLRGAMRYSTTVHPCVIGGERHLVYRHGLRASSPRVYRELAQFAGRNGFKLKEDERRTERPVPAERRNRFVPALVIGTALASVTSAQGPAAAEVESVVSAEPAIENVESIASAEAAIEEIEVLGQRQSVGRPYLIEAGKRFVSGPYGEVEAILGVAARVQAQGTKHRMSTRRMTIPDPGARPFVDRYDYTFPAECGGGTFSYYEGDGFAALGYHRGKRVVVDVLVGGGPFSSPKLWGPYDQVLNDNIKMDLMFGNGETDGMGLLKASYSIGMTPVMATEDFAGYGQRYDQAVGRASVCAGAGAPTLVQREDGSGAAGS